MNLTVAIESAELKFKQILEDFFVSVYTENNLPSHGIDHHRRVWRYAKELLLLPDSNVLFPSGHNPSKLIIACYLHDVAMSAFPGPRHGKKSRELCVKFLKNNRLSIAGKSELLDAVEFHDRKESLENHEKNDLLKVLSIADDLDAYGYTGIYRYTEISLVRGTKPTDLGNLIIDNARKRFDNFQKFLGPDNNYVISKKRKFDILTGFFDYYMKAAAEYNFETSKPEGYCGIIQIFMQMVRNKLSVADLFDGSKLYEEDTIISTFFHDLKSELEHFT